MKKTINPGTTILDTIASYFDHISIIGEYTKSYNKITSKTFEDAISVLNDPSIRVFVEWNQEIKELEYSLLLNPIDNRISFESDQTDVVFSATLLNYGKPMRTMVLNRYLLRSVKWNAKLARGGEWNKFRPLKVSSKNTLEKAKIVVVDFSNEAIGYIYNNLKRQKSHISTSKSLAYTAALIADGQKDSAIVFFDKNKIAISMAAAILLVKEAGGRVLKFDGSEITDPFEKTQGCIFLNSGIHFKTIKKIIIK
jgi:fructose-1,6-bisphosphatase/inositol monophosphatase family enzyme